MYFCADCAVHACERMNPEEFPKGCPSRREEMIEACNEEYRTEENYQFAKVCSEESLPGREPHCRIVDIMRVAKLCGYKKIGLGFCMGFAKEANVLIKVLRHHGFEVEAVVCKVGGVDKMALDIPNGGNAMCNPIAQAKFLNEQKTQFNIALGLCVGHDSLFFKYSEAPVTCLAAKDKVLGHNPCAALYTADGYYHNALYAPLGVGDEKA